VLKKLLNCAYMSSVSLIDVSVAGSLCELVEQSSLLRRVLKNSF
jgi:hypothetical protein